MTLLWLSIRNRNYQQSGLRTETFENTWKLSWQEFTRSTFWKDAIAKNVFQRRHKNLLKRRTNSFSHFFFNYKDSLTQIILTEKLLSEKNFDRCSKLGMVHQPAQVILAIPGWRLFEDLRRKRPELFVELVPSQKWFLWRSIHIYKWKQSKGSTYMCFQHCANTPKHFEKFPRHRRFDLRNKMILNGVVICASNLTWKYEFAESENVTRLWKYFFTLYLVLWNWT